MSESPSILLLEDDETELNELSIEAQFAGFRTVLKAESVEEAKRQLSEYGPVDAFVIDIALQGDRQGGYKFLKWVLS